VAGCARFCILRSAGKKAQCSQNRQKDRTFAHIHPPCKIMITTKTISDAVMCQWLLEAKPLIDGFSLTRIKAKQQCVALFAKDFIIIADDE
jgi:hypothetical protein